MVKTVIVTTSTILGGFLGWYLGGFDGFLYALVAFVIADYITGVLAAINQQELSSAVGFRGIARKILIFLLVGLANLLDVYILGHTGVLRMATIFIYISNEGISLIENALRLGLPIPKSFEKALATIRDQADSNLPADTPGDEGKTPPDQSLPDEPGQTLFDLDQEFAGGGDDPPEEQETRP